ncbi:MAG TPA: tetratricopeptide repeat protein [Actinomycetota bacterium]|nr:tetratricopeptide repeat protein [Actinomycetota bacterium]
MMEEAISPDDETIVGLRNRHLDFFLEMAQEAERFVLGEKSVSWSEFHDGEADNFRSALRWAIDSRQTDKALQLGQCLSTFFKRRHAPTESRRWLEQILALEGGDDPTRVRILISLGEILWATGQFEVARERYEEALRLARGLEEPRVEAQCLTQIGWCLWYMGRTQQALPYQEEAVEVLRRLELDAWVGADLAESLRGLGWSRMSLGDLAASVTLHEEALELLRLLGHPQLIVHHLGIHSNLLAHVGDLERAITLRIEEVQINKDLGRRDSLAFSLSYLGRQMLQAGDLEGAEPPISEALQISRELGTKSLILWTLLSLVELRLEQTEYQLVEETVHEALHVFSEIEDPTRQDEENRAGILAHAARAARMSGRRDQARLYLREAVAAHTPIIRGTVVSFVAALADMAREEEDRVAEVTIWKEVIGILDEVEAVWVGPKKVLARASLARAQGDDAGAKELAAQALETAEELGEQLLPPAFLGNAALLYEQGQVAEARGMLERALKLKPDDRDTLELLAAVSAAEGDLDACGRHVSALGQKWRSFHAPHRVGRLMETVAHLSAGRGAWPETAKLLGAAEAFRALVGVPRPRFEAEAYERTRSAAEGALGEGFAGFFENGLRLRPVDVLTSTG